MRVGMEVSEAMTLRGLARENTKLKKMFENLSLDDRMLMDLNSRVGAGLTAGCRGREVRIPREDCALQR